MRLANQEEDEDRKAEEADEDWREAGVEFSSGGCGSRQLPSSARLNLRSNLSISRGKKPPRDLDLSETLSLAGVTVSPRRTLSPSLSPSFLFKFPSSLETSRLIKTNKHVLVRLRFCRTTSKISQEFGLKIGRLSRGEREREKEREY